MAFAEAPQPVEIHHEERWPAFSSHLAQLPPEDIDIIKTAHRHAALAHKEAFRKSGEPYISHPEAVTLILLEKAHIKDPSILAAALLHDTVEDTGYWAKTGKMPAGESLDISIKNMVAEGISPIIAHLVRELSIPKVDEKEVANKKYAKHLYHEQLYTISTEAKLIKMADRLHNLKTLRNKEKGKQRQYVIETIVDLLPALRSSEEEHSQAYEILFTKLEDELRLVTKDLITPDDIAIAQQLQEESSDTDSQSTIVMQPSTEYSLAENL